MSDLTPETGAPRADSVLVTAALMDRLGLDLVVLSREEIARSQGGIHVGYDLRDDSYTIRRVRP